MSIMGRIAIALAVVATLTACGEDEPTIVIDRSGEQMEDAASESLPSPYGEGERLLIEEVTLHPSSPASGGTITARTRARGSDGKRPQLSYEWYVRGRLVPETSGTLRLPELRKGDHIRVVVSASEEGSPSVRLAQETKVANSPPRIRDLRLRRKTVGDAGEQWAAEVQAEDPDGDPVKIEYTWLVNGQPHGEQGSSFDSQLLKRSDQLQLRVVANDGESTSSAAETGVVTVSNSAPDITSTPPAVGADGKFSYQLAVTDADGDRNLKYTLEEGPRGMSVDSQSGLVTWTPSGDQGGRHRVQVSVDDRKGGKSSQAFELAIVVETQVGPAATP